MIIEMEDTIVSVYLRNSRHRNGNQKPHHYIRPREKNIYIYVDVYRIKYIHNDVYLRKMLQLK